MIGLPRKHRGLLLVLLLGLVVRLGWLTLYYEHDRSAGLNRLFLSLIPASWEEFRDDLAADRLFSDQVGYDRIARNLLSGRGYRLHDNEPPTAFRPPIYPMFLALIYAMHGSLLAVRVIQLLVELGTVWLLYAISRRAFRSERAALAGAAMYALYFPIVIYAGTLFTETLFTFLLALFVWLMVRAHDPGGGQSRPAQGFFLAGMALGLATLTRPTTLLFPIFLLLPIVLKWLRGIRTRPPPGGVRYWTRASDWRRDLRGEWVPLILGMGLVLLPWTIRNAVVLGEFVPVATGGGRIFWGCNYIPPDDPMIPQAARSAGHDVPTSDRGFYDRALRNIVAHPGLFIESSFRRLVRLWFNWGFDRPPSGASLAIGMANLIMMLFTGWALVVARGPWVRAWIPVFLLLGYFSVVHMVLEGYIRYALPVIPYLMLSAAFAGVTLAARGRARMVTS